MVVTNPLIRPALFFGGDGMTSAPSQIVAASMAGLITGVSWTTKIQQGGEISPGSRPVDTGTKWAQSHHDQKSGTHNSP